MKKSFILLPLLASLFLLPSCSEKFDIAAPYKNITVIYGLLRRADTAHYIRVQKAYLDNDKSALTMAKEADSSFYSNIEVKMVRLSMTNGRPMGSFTLNRVDLNQEGYTKAEGIFFNTPNYAYKFTDDLDPTFVYKLVVTNKTTGAIDSGETTIIDDKSADQFTVDLIDATDPRLKILDFSSTNTKAVVDISGRYRIPTYYNYGGRTSPVGLVQSFIRFHWVDSNISTGVKISRSYDMNLGYNNIASGASRFTYSVKNVDLTGALKVGMGKAPAGIFRLIDRMELMVYLGTHDFNTYISIQALQGVGLTGSEIQPSYTNLKGNDVLGLFTSRGYRSGFVTISDATVALLRNDATFADAMVRGTAY